MTRDDAASVGARTVPPGAVTRERSAAWAVVMPVAGLVFPTSCACCGAVATRHAREARRADGRAVLVPYCADCHAHLTAAGTRALAFGISSLLLALTMLSGLPLVWQPSGPVPLAGVVLAVSCAPLVVLARLSGAAREGHVTDARAAVFRGDALVCRSHDFAHELGTLSGVRVFAVPWREPVVPRWAAAGLAAAALAAFPLHGFHFPAVRVVNLGTNAIRVRLDGRDLGRVEATGSESAGAGRSLRMPAGRHHLEAVGPDGVVVHQAEVQIVAGQPHLFAPGSAGICFWIESTGYGRKAGAPAAHEALAGESRFWALPQEIDYWFAPAPPEGRDEWSSGGLVRALRQAPCTDAPADVRWSGGAAGGTADERQLPSFATDAD